MSGTDKLFRTFDGLQSDIDELLTRYRRVKQDRAKLLEACKAVEEWWLREGKNEFLGAPAAIFMVRAAIEKAEQS